MLIINNYIILPTLLFTTYTFTYISFIINLITHYRKRIKIIDKLSWIKLNVKHSLDYSLIIFKLQVLKLSFIFLLLTYLTLKCELLSSSIALFSLYSPCFLEENFSVYLGSKTLIVEWSFHSSIYSKRRPMGNPRIKPTWKLWRDNINNIMKYFYE